MVAASTCEFLGFAPSSFSGAPSTWSSGRNGPEEPRFRLRPVRLGALTFRSRLLVGTGVASKRLAKGSSGRNETDTSLGRASWPSALGWGSSFVVKAWELC